MDKRGRVVFWALLFDGLFGDPPSPFHPVAWMGQWLVLTRKRSPQRSIAESFLFGAVVVASSSAMLGLAGQWLVVRLQGWRFAWLVEAAMLSLLLSLRGLLKAGNAVADPLAQGDLPEARRQLSWHLVSRDTSYLDESQVAAATIESLAENASDSVIAPLFWYGVTGLPGALVYRFLNTADAMLGYRDAEREWLGKAPARFDDLANLIPARLTALLIIAAAPLAGGDSRRAWQIWRRDGNKTASPNAGHPMSAAAGALGIVLEKVDHYRLGEGLPAPAVTDIRRCQRLVTSSVCLSMLLTSIAWLRFPAERTE